MSSNDSTRALACAGALALAACQGESSPAPDPPPPPVPPPPTAASFDVEDCLTQMVRPGVTVAILYVPDTLKLDFREPSIFPNGRALPDPVIDYTLAMLFLDLTVHPISTLHSIPLGPPANDRPFPSAFPWLAPPQGDPPLDESLGRDFDIRTDPASAYVRVDRMGMPALATALISSSQKVPYNEDDPAVDFTFKWASELEESLTTLTNALADDFDQADLSICAEPVG